MTPVHGLFTYTGLNAPSYVSITHSTCWQVTLQARLWYKEHRLEWTKVEALRAADGSEKFGAVNELEICRGLLGRIEKKI